MGKEKYSAEHRELIRRSHEAFSTTHKLAEAFRALSQVGFTTAEVIRAFNKVARASGGAE